MDEQDSTLKSNMGISKTGAWIGTDLSEHVYDASLAKAMQRLIDRRYPNPRGIKVADFGCGTGAYVRALSQHYQVWGIDGNPDTPELTRNRCKVQDLTEPFDMKLRFDVLICLEVGEHIPPDLCHVFLENIRLHASDLLIISWGIPGQGGLGHVHCLPNDTVIELMKARGFEIAPGAEVLRASATRTWFKDTIMVFRKVPVRAIHP